LAQKVHVCVDGKSCETTGELSPAEVFATAFTVVGLPKRERFTVKLTLEVVFTIFEEATCDQLHTDGELPENL
jgi:hypothetical protein